MNTLFDLVASLTLDDKEYDKALQAAEAKAHSFDGDAEGIITGENEYSEAIDIAETDAMNFQGDATGTIDGDNTDYEGAIGESEELADNFDGDADGEIDGDNTDYEKAIQESEASANDFEGDVTGELSLDTNEYESGFADARQSAREFETDFREIAGKLAGVLTGAGIVASIKAVSGAFQEAINNASTYADTVDKSSQALGMSTATFQEWRYALGQSGADISNIRRGWINITEAITTSKTNLEAWSEDTSDVKKAFDTMGIDPRKFASAEELFDNIMHNLASMEASDERNNLVTALFGRNGMQLNALLNSGTEGMDDLIQRAHDLGLVMSDEDITKGVAFGDAMSDMNQAVDALKQNIVSGLFPLLTEAALAMANLVSTFNGRTQLTAYDKITGTWKDLNVALTETEDKEDVAQDLLKNLKDLSDESGHVKGNFEKWQAYASRLVQLFPNLNEYIDVQNGYIKTSTDELSKNIAEQARYEKQQALLLATEEQRAIVRQALSDAAKAEVELTEAQDRRSNAEQRAIEEARKVAAMYGLGAVNTIQDVEKLYSNEQYGYAFADAMKEYTDASAKVDEANKKLEKATTDYEKAKTAADEYSAAVQTVIDKLNAIPSGIFSEVTIKVNSIWDTFNSVLDGFRPHATGLDDVPYDGYRAELHRGEAVLTRAEANDWRSGNRGSGVDTAAIAAAVQEGIRAGLEGVGFYFDKEQVASAVTDSVSRNIANGVNAWRY